MRTTLKLLRYVLYGLILMAPQEFISTAIIKGSFVYYILSLMMWSVLLLMMYFIGYLITREKAKIAVIIIISIVLATVVEWVLMGNSPWKNPGANQFGLYAGWISVFVLPLLFLKDGFGPLKTWVRYYYVFFTIICIAPGLVNPLLGITLYGYAVIPFLIFSGIYVVNIFKTNQTMPKSI